MLVSAKSFLSTQQTLIKKTSFQLLLYVRARTSRLQFHVKINKKERLY